MKALFVHLEMPVIPTYTTVTCKGLGTRLSDVLTDSFCVGEHYTSGGLCPSPSGGASIVSTSQPEGRDEERMKALK